MSILRSILTAACGLLFAIPAAGQEVITRHTVTVTGIEEVPKTFTVAPVGLSTEVVVTDGTTPLVVKRPGRAEAEGVTFFIPLVDDEVVLFYNWWYRIASTGNWEPHAVDIVGYNSTGDPVARFYLENAWPSKVSGSPMRADGNSKLTDLRLAITLQADRIDLLPGAGTAPWPEIIDVSSNAAANTFTMTWRSVAEAEYKIFRWDARREEFVEDACVTATGNRASHTRPMIDKGIFYVLLASAPPPPGE